MIDLRLGKYQEVLADVRCDLVLADPPYSKRTHNGHNKSVNGHLGKKHDNASRRHIPYAHWTPTDVAEFCRFWGPRCDGWIAAMSDSDLCTPWRDELAAIGLYSFAPIPCVMPGMTVRLGGDGPSSWCVYLNVARPKKLVTWGTTPGAYYGPPDRGYMGGKPLWLMRQIVRDYSRAHQVVVDPCAGSATTLIAAATENRIAIGAEALRDTYLTAQARIGAGYTPTLPGLEDF